MYLKCIKCKKMYEMNFNRISCDNHSLYYSYLDVEYSDECYEKAQATKNLKYLMPGQYKSKLIIKTPLIDSEFLSSKHDTKVYLKLENKNPTGSPKDRDMDLITSLLEKNTPVNISSGGNGAVSGAIFSHLNGLSCTCYVPNSLDNAREKILTNFSANIVKIEGDYETVFRHSINNCGHSINITPGINPIAQEGCKAISWEIFEDLGVPEIVVVPCGNGSTLFSIIKGFIELKKIGLTEKLPKFIGVQLLGSSPLKQAIEQNKDHVTLDYVQPSIAGSILARESFTAPKLLDFKKKVSLNILEVVDGEIKENLHQLFKKQGLLVDPAAAAGVATLENIDFSEVKNVVVVITG